MEKEIMVKVCPRCGIANSEKADECESCGAELGMPLKSREANKLSRKIAKKNEKIKNAIAAEKFGGMEEEALEIPITPSRIIIASVGFLVAAGIVVLMVLSALYPHKGSGGELFLIDIGSLVLLAIAILFCLLPGEMWALCHCMDSIFYKEMPQPTDTALVMQQVGCVILILLGGGVFALHLLAFCGVL